MLLCKGGYCDSRCDVVIAVVVGDAYIFDVIAHDINTAKVVALVQSWAMQCGMRHEQFF